MFQLKLMVDNMKKKVIFAEADKKFVDFLFSFLTVPICSIIEILGGKSYVGSMDMLYGSVHNMDERLFNTKACKSKLLKPFESIGSHFDDLASRVDSGKPAMLHQCQKGERPTKCFAFYSSISIVIRFFSGEIMSLSLIFDVVDLGELPEDGAFVKGNNTYIISDDLKIMPASLTAIQNILDKLKINNLDGIKESYIVLDEGSSLRDLLRRSLISTSPLSDIYFREPIASIDSHFMSKLLPKLEMGLTNNDKSKNFTAKLVMCEASNEVLYVESKGEDLVDLLLSFLTYPLGFIVKLLNKCSSFGCIDNLYQSIDAKFVKPEFLSTLLNHKLAPFIGCSTSLPLIGEMSASCGTLTEGEDTGGGYAKKGVKFIITNNLELFPSSPSNILLTIKRHKLIAAHLEEKEIQIGKYEALNLLKACLISKNPLTDVFGTKK